MRGAARVGDFGTGSAILPLLMSDNAPRATFDAWEIQPEIADMAARCVAMNGLDARIHVRTGDARAAMRDVGHGTLDMVVCNPPYYRGGKPGLKVLPPLILANENGSPAIIGV